MTIIINFIIITITSVMIIILLQNTLPFLYFLLFTLLTKFLRLPLNFLTLLFLFYSCKARD